MITSKNEIKYIKKDNSVLICDDYINVDFIKEYLGVKQSKAYLIMRATNKLLLNKYGITPVVQGRTTLSGFYEYMNLKGKFD